VNIRTTTQVQAQRNLVNIRRQTEVMADMYQQASTGIRLLRPSDDPRGIVNALGSKSQIARLEAHQANIKEATSLLNHSVSFLQEANNLMTKARETAIDGANSVHDADALEVLAQEVDELLNRMVAVANAQVEGRSLFAGTATDRTAFAVTAQNAQGKPAAVAYQGAEQRARTLIGKDQTIETLYAGEDVFGEGGADAFNSLMGLREDLRNTAGLTPNQQAQALSQRLGDLEKTQQSLLKTVGQMSGSLEHLEALGNRLEDVVVLSRERLGEIESADIAEVVINLSTQETLLQTTLAASSRLLELNLMDYLR
jgi:flagellar hook-associated protein 3 FlgL